MAILLPILAFMFVAFMLLVFILLKFIIIFTLEQPASAGWMRGRLLLGRKHLLVRNFDLLAIHLFPVEQRGHCLTQLLVLLNQ